MNRTILYYPTIDIPKKEWLRHALLYWDQVSSIVPDDKKIRNRLSGAIDYLIDEGQFRPIKPEELTHQPNNWEVLQQFSEEFKEIVNTQEFQHLILKQNRVIRPRQIHINKLPGNFFTQIHTNKTTDGIVDFLKEKGLASDLDHSWLNMERYTALLYMSLLAKYLADIDSNQTTIGTDFVSYEKFNFRKVKGGQGLPVIDFHLNKVLPTPSPDVSIEKIVQFKRERVDNLSHFKKILSDFNSKISKAESHAEMKESAITFHETLKAGVLDLAAVLDDSKIEYRFKTLKSLINIKSPATWLAAGAMAGKALGIVSIPFSIPIIGLAVAGTIDLSTNFIENRNKNRLKLRESPFSYIYQAQQYGIVKKYR